MKLNFTNVTIFTPMWNGNKDLPEDEQVKVTIKDMDLTDLIAVADAMGDLVGSGAMDQEKVPVTQIKSLITAAKEILPKYCTLENLEDSQGNPVQITDILGSSKYINLMLEVFTEIVNTSEVSEEDQGNSPAQSA